MTIDDHSTRWQTGELYSLLDVLKAGGFHVKSRAGLLARIERGEVPPPHKIGRLYFWSGDSIIAYRRAANEAAKAAAAGFFTNRPQADNQDSLNREVSA